MKLVADHFAIPMPAARELVELAKAFEPVQHGRIHIEQRAASRGGPALDGDSDGMLHDTGHHGARSELIRLPLAGSSPS